MSSKGQKRKAPVEKGSSESPLSKLKPLEARLKSKKKLKLPKDRPIRVYADGIFDMFHFGHARMLQQAKNVFPGHEVYLLVGVCNDELTHRMKGQTVFADYERYESVRHCKHVDEVITDAPWVLTQEFLDKHAIDFVAHDEDPYPDASGAADDVYAFVKEQNKFVATQRTEGISTSDIINRIVKNYDAYIKRNLQRGYSRQDLNISFLKEQSIKAAQGVKSLQNRVEQNFQKLGDNVKNNIEDNVEEIQANIQQWMVNSRSFIDGFVNLFRK